MVELVDAIDSKSIILTDVPVQVWPGAPFIVNIWFNKSSWSECAEAASKAIVLCAGQDLVLNKVCPITSPRDEVIFDEVQGVLKGFKSKRS